MVNIVCKGTTHPDEFIFAASCSELIGDVAKKLCKIQNNRHRLRLQLYSIFELQPTVKKAAPTSAAQFSADYERINSRFRDPKVEVTLDEAQESWELFRNWVVKVFPEDCTNKDGPEAAVDQLFAKHDNPDIDEEYRLHIYHLRACMDPKNLSNEYLPEDQVAAFFCGKQLDDKNTIGSLCSNNEKSKITLKLGRAGGAAPSKEPRIDYAAQRELRARHIAKIEEFKTLEDSELRDRVLKQARAGMALPKGGSSGSGSGTSSSGVSAPVSMNVNKHIYSNAKETLVDAE